MSLYPIPEQARDNMLAFSRGIALFFVSFELTIDGCVSLFEKRVRAHSQTEAISKATTEVRSEHPNADMLVFTGIRKCQ
jgi:hypothetical protein